MEVIFIVADMAGGGTERVIANLANGFSRRGIKAAIVMTAGNTSVYKLDREVELIPLGGQTGGSISKRLQRIRKIRNVIRSRKNAVVLSFGTETNLFAILASLGLSNQLAVSERNDPNRCSYKWFRNFLYHFAGKLVFQTEDAKKHFSKRIQRRSVVIPNPLSDNLPVPYHGARTKKIVAVGRLTAQKNHALLLDAFARFCNRIEGYELIVYGEGELREDLVKMAKGLQVDKFVSFPGFVTGVLEEIKDAAMYVLSSDYEGISNSLAEALAIGLPCISTDCPIGGSRMCIENEVNGILVPVNNPERLAEAMIKLVSEEKFAAKLSKNAEQIRELLSFEKLIETWMKIIEE